MTGTPQRAGQRGLDRGHLPLLRVSSEGTLAEPLGISVDRSSKDSAIATVRADERHLNPGGTVHGGAIATLVDVAMGAAVFAGGDGDERSRSRSS